MISIKRLRKRIRRNFNGAFKRPFSALRLDRIRGVCLQWQTTNNSPTFPKLCKARWNDVCCASRQAGNLNRVLLPDDDGTAMLTATFVSFDANGWTNNFSAVDGTAKKFWAVAIGEESVAVSDPPSASFRKTRQNVQLQM